MIAMMSLQLYPIFSRNLRIIGCLTLLAYRGAVNRESGFAVSPFLPGADNLAGVVFNPAVERSILHFKMFCGFGLIAVEKG